MGFAPLLIQRRRSRGVDAGRAQFIGGECVTQQVRQPKAKVMLRHL
jgi:hypothetical protein